MPAAVVAEIEPLWPQVVVAVDGLRRHWHRCRCNRQQPCYLTCPTCLTCFMDKSFAILDKSWDKLSAPITGLTCLQPDKSNTSCGLVTCSSEFIFRAF